MGPEDARRPRRDPDKSRLAEQGRPSDYIEALKLEKGAMKALFARVQRGSRRRFGPDIGDDVTSEALRNLMTARQPLETAPPLHGDRDEAWIRTATAALANYALSRRAMVSAFRAACKGRLWEAKGRKDGGNESEGIVLESADVVDVGAEEDRERSEEANAFREVWAALEPELRAHWIGNDESRNQFFEILLRMMREDGVSPLAAGRDEEGAENRFLRGGGERSKGVQLNNAAVLARLQGAFPDDEWTLQAVQLRGDSLRRFIFRSASTAAVVRDALGLRSRPKP